MRLDRITVSNFKRIMEMDIALGDITYIVGGNNSGKSSFLQAVHMAVSCAQRASELGQRIIAESRLRYCPTGDFQQLGHVKPYENREDGSRGVIEFYGKTNDGASASYKISLYRARNFFNIGIERSGVYPGFGQYICDYNTLFSVYVPGLSGVSHQEEMQSYSSVFKRAAGGEANLVFRNIIRLINEKKQLSILENFLFQIMGPIKFRVNFNSEKDFYIDIKVSFEEGFRESSFVSIDLCGTGILQITQIIAYVILFKPKILLIDEPDSHLHPSRQARVAKVFENIIADYNCKIVVSTHSRHMISAAGSDAKIIWLKNGRVEADDARDLTQMLMDLGALDQIDKGGAEIIICTEDKGKYALDMCVKEMGLGGRISIISYNGVSNASSAVIIQEIGSLFSKKPRIIIHRDRDFLVDQELEKWSKPFTDRGIVIFCPKLPDVESYYVDISHVAECYGLSEIQVQAEIDAILNSSIETFRSKYREKRKEAIKKYWEDGGGPATSSLWPENEKINQEKILGKTLITKINETFGRKFGGRKNLMSTPSAKLKSEIYNLISGLGLNP